jgi:N-acetylmuramoyl-L-alanine amidase
MTAGKLTVGADGRLRGLASIGFSDPFPAPNRSHGSGAMNGVIMHTEVGYDHNVVTEFVTPASQASAFFSVRDDGHITQYIQVGKGDYSWAQMAGNQAWYSIEHEDHGNQENPLTDAQLTASAQLVECLSAYAGFPLEVTDSVDGRGYGTHVMGGAAWGGHTCPGPGPRAAQRHDIIALARQIRAGTPPPATEADYTTTGSESLVSLAASRKCGAMRILRLTVERDGMFSPGLAAYGNMGDLHALMPAGLILRVPAGFARSNLALPTAHGEDPGVAAGTNSREGLVLAIVRFDAWPDVPDTVILRTAGAFSEYLSHCPPGLPDGTVAGALETIIDRLDKIAMSQAEINTDVQALQGAFATIVTAEQANTAAVAAVATEITALQAQVAAGQPVDLTALSALVNGSADGTTPGAVATAAEVTAGVTAVQGLVPPAPVA